MKVIYEHRTEMSWKPQNIDHRLFYLKLKRDGLMVQSKLKIKVLREKLFLVRKILDLNKSVIFTQLCMDSCILTMNITSFTHICFTAKYDLSCDKKSYVSPYVLTQTLGGN